MPNLTFINLQLSKLFQNTCRRTIGVTLQSQRDSTTVGGPKHMGLLCPLASNKDRKLRVLLFLPLWSAFLTVMLFPFHSLKSYPKRQSPFASLQPEAKKSLTTRKGGPQSHLVITLHFIQCIYHYCFPPSPNPHSYIKNASIVIIKSAPPQVIADSFWLEVTATEKQVSLGSWLPMKCSTSSLVESHEWLPELNKMPPRRNSKFCILKSKRWLQKP